MNVVYTHVMVLKYHTLFKKKSLRGILNLCKWSKIIYSAGLTGPGPADFKGLVKL